MNPPNLPRVPDGLSADCRSPSSAVRGLLLFAALGPAASLFGCADRDAGPARDPGRVTLHRLNRTEYNSTVRDLLGTTLRPADAFPSDDVGYGFDNIADVLSLSPLQLELYQRAAEQLVDEVLRPSGALIQQEFTESQIPVKVGASRRGRFVLLTSNVEVGVLVGLPQAGKYRVAVRAYEDPAPPDHAKMTVSVDGLPVQTFDVAALQAAPQVYAVTVDLGAGTHTVAVAFINDAYEPMKFDRNLAFDQLRIEGPTELPPHVSRRERVLVCTPEDASADAELGCARVLLARFAKQAWRRPVTADEVARLVGFVEQARAEGDPFETGIRVALQAVLISPHFLFRVEQDPAPGSAEPHPLSGHELASRLSYFLRSSMPDDALMQAADAGLLDGGGDDATLRAQVARLFDDPDPRADTLLDNFAAQWLALRALDEIEPNPTLFPAWREELRAAMRTETRLYLREFFRAPEPLGLDQLLRAPLSFVSGPLAQFYGLAVPPGAGAKDFQRVALDGTPRRGLLTQGSVLAMNSYPGRTSPVKRGKWVLEQLLCTPPPPPPPDVIGNFGQGPASGTLRQRFEAHRKDPVCAGCHRLMDPVGFSLEHFDGIGAFRTHDGKDPVDASGALPDGRTFQDAAELGEILASDPRLMHCAVEKLFTYALGRPPADFDRERLDELTAGFAQDGFKLRDLVMRVVLSDAFRFRRGEPEAASPESQSGGAP